MSDSDSPNHQKVAALAEALEAVRRNIGSKDALNGSLYMWMSALGPDPEPWHGTPEEARERVLAEIAEFVKAVDTAEQRLNAVPFSDFEPLSPFTDGVRWDVRTRRTLKEIQVSISILRHYSTKPDFLLYLLRAQCTSASNSLQQKLSKYLNELNDRIFDLRCLPDDKHPKGDASPPPKYDPNSVDWILSETLCNVIGIKASTITEYRKPRKCGKDRIDEFGSWNVDCVGKFRRQVNRKGSVAYYRPAMSDSYKARLTYAESKNQKP